MRGRRDEILRAGAQLVFIGSGTVPQARAFQARYAPDCEVYTDPKLTAYTALGFKRSVAATLGPASTLAFVRATARGHRQTSIEGDAWQQGGLLATAPGGRLLYIERNRGAGDRPDLDAALKAFVARRPERAVRRRPQLG